MTTKIILTITLLAYSVIASQAFMYMLALKDVQLNLQGSTYTIIRQLIDTFMRNNLKYVIYAALLSNLLLMLSEIKTPGSLQFITASIAFIALVIDVVLTLKGNLPINNIINTWSADTYPSNWMQYRDQWFVIFGYRQLAVISGFVSLLIGTVFCTR